MKTWGLDRRSALALAACAAGVIAVTASPTPAFAGTFVLHQCGGAKQAKGGFQPAEPHGSSFQVVDTCSNNVAAPALEVTQISNASNEKRGFWHLSAIHPSLRFAAVSARVKLVNGSNSRARLVATNLDPSDGGNGTDWGTTIADGGVIGSEWQNVSKSGLDHSHLKMGIQCFAATCNLKDGSSGNPVQGAKARNFEITVRDTGAPSVSASGALLNDNSLIRGEQVGTVSASDSGAGIDHIETRVNGSSVDLTNGNCGNVLGAVATTQAPCTGYVTKELRSNVDDSSPWRYGANTVQICAYDFYTGGTANSECTARTVWVDNRPDGPDSLTTPISGWINDKAKFSAAIGTPSSVAPLTRLHYRLIGPAGYERTGYKTSGFAAITGAELPALGEPGEYTLRLWFEDSLGNVNEAGTARSVTFKYDPVKPEAALLEQHNGWVSSYDFDPAFVQHWAEPANDGAYPSGLRGYAIAISPDPERDPCDGGPTPACDAEEITHGPFEQSVRLEAQDRPDGHYYASSVPVTNAENRGPRSQAKLLIDRTNPVVGISGIPTGWSRDPVTITAHAEDTTSGMVPAAPQEMPDGPPVTALRIGDGPYQEASGDTARATVSADGIHRISYYARDLAGNRNDGSVEVRSGYRFASPETATARIDGTAPVGAFKEPSRDDPTLQRIEVGDATSGVEKVTLQLRRKGSDDWYSLETNHNDGEYLTRVDESQWEEGIYEIRALATDVAGNTVALDRFEDGSPAMLSLPLREATGATIDAPQTRATAGSGKARWHIVGYRERPVYFGRLFDVDGDPIARADVQVRERFDAGSHVKQRRLPTVTDADGRYRVTGSAGPSRATRILFGGDRRFRPTRSAYVRTLVRGSVHLSHYPRRIEAGKPAVFRGKIARDGVKIPDRGKLYEVQLLVPGEGWKTLDQAQHSRPDGSFRFVYRFRPVLSAVTFRMRVQVKRDPEWAYTQARSHKVAVTVTP